MEGSSDRPSSPVASEAMETLQTPTVSKIALEFRQRSGSDSCLSSTSQRGSKRLLTSPTESANKKEPIILGDVDLQALKESLAGHDYNFASINAISKESVAKKKELEAIISAYRRAVDKMIMAYIQIKTERDTTMRIWEMIRDEVAGRKGSRVEELETIREVAGTAMRETLEGWRESSGCVASGPSYAGVLRLSRPAAGGETLPVSSDWAPVGGRVRRVETLEVTSQPSDDGKVDDSSVTLKAVTDAIKPAQCGARVERILKTRGGAIRIVAEKGELDKLRPALNETGLNIKQVSKLNPRLIVRDIPAEMERSEFIECLTKLNLKGVNESVKLVYWYPVNNRKNTSAIIEVSSDVRKKLLDQGRIYVGWSSCRVFDHLDVTQCFKCLSFGHLAKACRSVKDVCGHCGGEHESRVCSNRNETPSCHNCKTARMTAVDHSAFDASKCPILQRKRNEKARRIQY